jgi:hypothetical protein
MQTHRRAFLLRIAPGNERSHGLASAPSLAAPHDLAVPDSDSPASFFAALPAAVRRLTYPARRFCLSLEHRPRSPAAGEAIATARVARCASVGGAGPGIPSTRMEIGIRWQRTLRRAIARGGCRRKELLTRPARHRPTARRITSLLAVRPTISGATSLPLFFT